MPRRGMAGASCSICAAFSASVSRDTMSRARSSNESSGSWNGIAKFWTSDIESEILPCVAKTNRFDEPGQKCRIVRHEAAAHIVAEHVTQQAPEVLVARVRQEAPRVCEHADEAREQAQVGQGVHLLLHAVELIEEPPGAAVLHLAGDAAVLEVARQGREHLVIARVEVIEDGPRQLI